ncbi:hypothetical protein CR513_12211, partial [Mucuna pruriens]
MLCGCVYFEVSMNVLTNLFPQSVILIMDLKFGEVPYLHGNIFSMDKDGLLEMKSRHNRGLYDNELCTLCHIEDKIIQVLRDYVHAKLVWQNISPNFLVYFFSSGLVDWLIRNQNKTQIDQSSIRWRKLFTTIANILRQTQNKFLFPREDFHCQSIYKLI